MFINFSNNNNNNKRRRRRRHIRKNNIDRKEVLESVLDTCKFQFYYNFQFKFEFISKSSRILYVVALLIFFTSEFAVNARSKKAEK